MTTVPQRYRDEKWTENSSTAITYDPMHKMLCRVWQNYVLTTYTYIFCFYKYESKLGNENQMLQTIITAVSGY